MTDGRGDSGQYNAQRGREIIDASCAAAGFSPPELARAAPPSHLGEVRVDWEKLQVAAAGLVREAGVGARGSHVELLDVGGIDSLRGDKREGARR